MPKTRLPKPHSHITVEYPYNWPGFVDPVHVFNEKTGTGTLYHGDFARALADGIKSATSTPEGTTP